MTAVFLRILNLGIAAGWLILTVVAARLLLRRAPKRLVCALWILVAVRLLCPIRLESPLSLLPADDPFTVSEDAAHGSPENDPGLTAAFSSDVPASDPAGYNPEDSENASADVPQGAGQGLLQPVTLPGETGVVPDTAVAADTSAKADSGDSAKNSTSAASVVFGFSATLSPRVIRIAAAVWMAGAVLILGFAAVSYLRIRRTVAASIAVGDQLYACDDISSPFILGIARPRIYVPSAVTGESLSHIVAHESAHLRRRDHWWKPLGYLLLAVYWFNPLCWLAYALLCRDIELACDESVIHAMSHDDIAAYSQTLLDFNRLRRTVAVCPLAFGMVGVKRRVKSVLNYKKPPFWIILAAVVVTAVVLICFFASPKKSGGSDTAPTATPADATTTPTPTEGGVLTPTPRITGPIESSGVSRFLGQIGEIGSDTFIVYTSQIEGPMMKYYSFEIPRSWLPASPRTAVGNWVEICCDGRVEATSPARLPQITSVRLFVRPGQPFASEAVIRESHPEVFELDAGNGLTVAVWQLGAGSYNCTLFAGTNIDRAPLQEELLKRPHYDIPTMKMILNTYRLPKDKIRIFPTYSFISSYAGAIDSEYVESLFFDAVDVRDASAWANWRDDKQMESWLSTAANYEQYASQPQTPSDFRQLPVFVLNSQSEIDTFCNRAEKVGLQTTSGYDRDPSLLQTIADNGFVGDFFDDYALLITYVTAGSSDRAFGTECILIDDTSLTVRIHRTDKHGEVGNCQMGGWYVLTAVPKAFLSGRTLTSELNRQ